ncbi:MAG: hypothetical protein R2749_12300 [Acidimicrobiales bacterium]
MARTNVGYTSKRWVQPLVDVASNTALSGPLAASSLVTPPVSVPPGWKYSSVSWPMPRNSPSKPLPGW